MLACSAALTAGGSQAAQAACCYFSALGSDVNQPSQKAFLTWNPQEKLESFTVQPRFEGNAADFGMVIPTPSRPRLNEMPRDFFKELAVFTILKPMPLDIPGVEVLNPVFHLTGRHLFGVVHHCR